jgi:predicted nucleic acid-binding Zn ribbon protein
MSEHCPECGAALPEGSTCETIHHELLNFEYTHAIPHSTHFMMVTCYLVQHGRYSDEGLIWAQSMLRAHLDEQMTEQQLQRLLTQKEKGTPRTWKYNRAADARPLPKIAWEMTIVDVAQHAQDAATYRQRVRQWAGCTLRQMADLLSNSG